MHSTLASLPFVALAVAGGAFALFPQDEDVASWTWEFTPELEADGFRASPTPWNGPRLLRVTEATFAPEEHGGGLVLNLSPDALGGSATPSRLELPSRELTAEAWVALESLTRWGGIVGCVTDDGDHEKGWVLGYDEGRFTFGLSTTGTDDGDGRLVYLAGTTKPRSGAWHHVVGTFDGKEARLYVDGALEASSDDVTGDLLYDPASPFVIGAYRDSNEDYPVDGRLRKVHVGAYALDESGVAARAVEGAALRELEPWTDLEFEFLVEPFLTWPTTSEVSLQFETTYPSTGQVRVVDARPDVEGRFVERLRAFKSTDGLHTSRLGGLEPSTKYFYQVTATGPHGEQIESPQRSFRTAPAPDDAYTFVVVGDTQTNGEVAKRVSDLAFEHRPNLVVHAGDLVDTGSNKRDWTHTFFPSMQPLLAHVPLMPVLGNHEQDADHYYRYMSLPQPERWYSFTFGNAEFFMIDGNRTLADHSAQLEWLEEALEESTATWRFAVLHQPPYTSDSNDYGDTAVEGSTRGDLNARNIVKLLEAHDVDVCFSGHVHDYERTFPIRGGKVTPYEEGGVIYVTAAGGGGSLEDFDATNTWFGHKKARRHHFVYVAIHGDQLEFQAVDEDGRLFDLMTLEKRGR